MTSDPAERPAAEPTVTAWSPLRQPVFRMLWTAWLTANVSMWMNDVAAAWLMTTLSTDPVLVALVQTASTLPVFLLALPSGAMADIVDRRKLFIGTQLWVAVAATLLAVAAWSGTLSGYALLLLVFLHGMGLAVRWPVFAAAVPEVVSRVELPQAMALNAVAMHVSRIIGPVAAGALLAAVGSAYVFALNAVLSLAVAALIWRWRHQARASALPGERFVGAMRVGLQYVAQSPPLRVVLLRVFVFLLHISALIALLPLIAKGMPGGGAGTYTALLSCMGLGAVAATMWMPKMRQRMSQQRVLVAATLVHAAATAVVACAPNVWVAALAMLPAGSAWIAAGSSMTVSAQLSLPDWARARGMSIFLMAFMAGTAAGAALWGSVASYAGVRNGLLTSSALALVLLAALRRWRLEDRTAEDDLMPRPTDIPVVTTSPVEPGSGPVVVTIEYLIDAQDERAFAEVMKETRRSRLRGGALSWGLMRDADDPHCYIEYFMDENWVEHQRRIDRLTAGDARLRQRRLALHKGMQPPRTTRFVGKNVVG
ncbi:MFS transporter [Azohydromonas australica]|uniref:MFS transporter n=1 Tax=Azohydromonas australica TaxID=364039 RepID=UPI00048C2A17|nr:MFS transporter [Azohydromonas australica]